MHTPKAALVCLVIGGIVFFSLSVAMFVLIGGTVTLTVPYRTGDGQTCKELNTNCSVLFSIDEDIPPPIYFSYQLDDFYQNHRLFIQSKSNQQLAGSTISHSQADLCHPYKTNQQMGVTHSWNGTLLDPQAIASPCGSIARAIFNDSFSLKLTNNNAEVNLRQTGLTWSGDQG